MKKLDFNIPFSGFASTTFINCFTAVYLYLEGTGADNGSATFCNDRENGSCNGCGNCGSKPGAISEKYFFLFDTVCGRSALRCAFDGSVTEGEKLVNLTGFYDGAADGNVDFLFGYAGYGYRSETRTGVFTDEIDRSLSRGTPVIARLRGDKDVRFAVITGIDGERLLCPSYRPAQNPPPGEIAPGDLCELYIITGKDAPRYTFTDALKRVEGIMDSAAAARLWDGCAAKMTKYGADGLDSTDADGKRARMKRITEIMWHTFNCHNFAEVFRVYLNDRPGAFRYADIGGIAGLAVPELRPSLDLISRSCGYTHDLAWCLIGLEQSADWERHASSYFGEMIELTLCRIRDNDRDTLSALRAIIDKYR